MSNMVLKSRITIYGSQTATEGAVIRRGDLLQSKTLLLAVLYTLHSQNGDAAPVVDDHGPHFPNQNLEYATDFGGLPNLG